MSFHKAVSFFESVKFAVNGINKAFKTQRNFKIMCFIALVVIILSFVFKLEYVEWAVIFVCLFFTMFAEIINTSIESLIDNCYGETYSSHAETVKDCTAGAVLLLAIGDILIGFIIFLPKFISMIGY
ncbi:MAG: diacylglycerol kinase family protein [Vampirovibrionia bacterium]